MEIWRKRVDLMVFKKWCRGSDKFATSKKGPCLLTLLLNIWEETQEFMNCNKKMTMSTIKNENALT